MSSTQPKQRKGKAKWTQKGVDQARWDTATTTVFIHLCAKQVCKGNRSSTHLNSTGWDEVIKYFFEQTGKPYCYMQLKNKWDALKREWVNWHKLVHGESGLGRDPVTGAITAPDSWWTMKLQAHPEAAKFRHKPLLLEDEMQTIFSGVAATGEHAYTPSSGTMPSSAPSKSPKRSADGLGSPTDATSPISFTPGSTTRTRTQNSAITKRPRNEMKSESISDTLKTSLEKILEMASTADSLPKETTETIIYTFEQCVDVYNGIPAAQGDDDLFVFALRMFENPTKRRSFMMANSDERRIKWLQMEREFSIAMLDYTKRKHWQPFGGTS